MKSWNVRDILEGIFLPLMMTVLLGVFLYALSINKAEEDARTLAGKVEKQHNEVVRLRRENQRLAEETSAIERRSPAMMEYLAREDGRLIRPGEIVIVMPSKTP